VEGGQQHATCEKVRVTCAGRAVGPRGARLALRCRPRWAAAGIQHRWHPAWSAQRTATLAAPKAFLRSPAASSQPPAAASPKQQPAASPRPPAPHLLVPAGIGCVAADQLGLPALRVGVARVHAHQVARPDARLVAASTCNRVSWEAQWPADCVARRAPGGMSQQAQLQGRWAAGTMCHPAALQLSRPAAHRGSPPGCHSRGQRKHVPCPEQRRQPARRDPPPRALTSSTSTTHQP
jgi:hypothetical protein